jgi:hypothetical protein
MTPQPSAAAQLTLDPATTDETLATIFGAQRVDPERTPAQQQTQRDAAIALIAMLRPSDPVEGVYAAHAVAAHYGAVECFRRAVLSDTPDSVALRWYGRAMALSRMNAEMIRTLKQCQAENPRAQPQPHTQVVAQPALPPSWALAEMARRAAAVPAQLVGKQACPRALDPRDPMSSERPAPAPAAFPVTARPAPAAPFPAAPLPRQDARAALLGSTSQVGAMLTAAAA